VSGLAPPLPFPDQTFDLVFGISVFTHLRESWQFAWLRELARTLKPGGLAIMTIMSEGQAALQGASREMVDQIAQSGFLITDDNDQLRLSTGSENYYVNVYHSAKYIFREWAKFFNDWIMSHLSEPIRIWSYWSEYDHKPPGRVRGF
jgi:ubiquinone/menaquinone biosynthesis C-methylase UbiE